MGLVMTGSLMVGQMAPLFSAPNDAGDNVQLATLLSNGNLLIAFIHGTWCAHCVQTLYMLQHNTQWFSAAGVQIAVAAIDSPFVLRIFRKTAPVPITYTLLADQDQVVHKTYHLEALSAYMTIDRVGIIRGVFIDPDHQSYPGRSIITQSFDVVGK